MSLRKSYRRWLGEQVRRTRRYLQDVETIGPEDRAAERFFYFGEGAGLIAPHGVLLNEYSISIGNGTLVGPYVSLSAGFTPGQEMGSSPVLRIGSRCVVGRNTHIVGHFSIVIGDDVQMGPGVYVTDQNHGYDDPEKPIGLQAPKNAPVTIGAGSWVGAHAVILPGAVEGEQSVIAAGAVVRGAFPARVVVAGVPARIVRTWDPDLGWTKA
jgi:acetyltransferase-like isoleucine patch superfamily enzyme